MLPTVVVGRGRIIRLVQSWSQALRLHNWSKNLAIFAPVVFAHAFGDPKTIGIVSAGFLALCLVASASYIINDYADLSFDRQHPSKRHRPFAAGHVSIRAGLLAAVLLLVAACAIALALPVAFRLMLLAYLALAAAYSFGLKRVPLLDAFVIATLFLLRVAMGAAAIDAAQSPWLLSFSFVFFLSLVCSKRYCEITHTAAAGDTEISGRGYRVDDSALMLHFGIVAAFASIIIVLIYLMMDVAPPGFYPHIAFLYIVPACILMWFMRIWLLAHRTEMNEDPVLFMLNDPPSLLLACAVIVAFALSL
jgi:4-hydroxybenzoate polyprenyltransferase